MTTFQSLVLTAAIGCSAFLTASTPCNAPCIVDPEKSFHLDNNCQNSQNDGEGENCCNGEGKKHWYFHYHHYDYDRDTDPTEELDEETAWPGQREEYSDTLFR